MERRKMERNKETRIVRTKSYRRGKIYSDKKKVNTNNGIK